MLQKLFTEKLKVFSTSCGLSARRGRRSQRGRTNTICRHSGAAGASVTGHLAHFPGVRHAADAAILLADGIDNVEELLCFILLVTHSDQSLHDILNGPSEGEDPELR